MKRALIVCPGRGSYSRGSLGSLADRSEPVQAMVRACDEWRVAHGRSSVTALDAAESFRGTMHVAGENASLLTFACSMADFLEVDPDRYEVVGIVGNSLGWYTALAASGALPLFDAIRLIDTMGNYQAGQSLGGQIMTTVIDPDGAPSPALRTAVESAMNRTREEGGQAWISIDLGSHLVLGANTLGLKLLERHLPAIEDGKRTFPLRLPLHSAFHTPLLEPTQARAATELADLNFQAPNAPLFDGRGTVFRPHWASPADLRDYTLGHQIVRPFHFERALQSALAHLAPDTIIQLGPGNSLGGPISRLLMREGWFGLKPGVTWSDRQSTDPVFLSFGMAPQRPLISANPSA